MKILAQTNVLLKLSALAQMSPDCTPPEPEVSEEQKKADLERKAKESEERIEQIKVYFNRKMLRMNDGANSQSMSSQGDKVKKNPVMMIKVDIIKVMFVIPTSEHIETLVTSGDLNIILEMFEPFPTAEVWEIQEGLTKVKKETESIESTNLAMKLNLHLLNFQIFYCDFVEFLKKPWKKVSKRHILMPLMMFINLFEFKPVTKFEEKLEYYTYRKITGGGRTMVFKLALSDIDLLNRVMAYQLKLLAEGSPPPAEGQGDKKIEAIEENPRQEKDKIQAALEKMDIEKSENDELLVKVDPIQDKLAIADKKQTLEEHLAIINKTRIENLKFSGMQLFLINDDQKVFVPVLDFVISDILLNIHQSQDLDIDAIFGLGVEYYNPIVSKWEPFIERTNFFSMVKLNKDNDVNTTYICLKLNESDKNIEEVLNINLSVKALAVVMNTLGTLTAWNEKRAEDEKKIKAQTTGFLSHLLNVDDIGDIGPRNEHEIEEKIEDILEDQNKIDYVSPYLIKNLTGYPITAEEYVNKAEFKEMGEKSICESLNDDNIDQLKRSRTAKQSKFTREKSGTTYNLKNLETLNLKFETGSKLKEDGTNRKFVLEQQENEKKLMIKISHDSFKIKSIYNITIDQKYSKRIRLKGDKNILKEFSIVCDSFFDDKKKILTVSSTCLVQNLTNESITFRVYGKLPVDLELFPSDVKPVPFDMVANMYQILFKGNETVKSSLQKLTNKEDGFFKKVQLSEDKFVIIRVKRDPTIFQRIVLVFLPVIRLKNCLPFQSSFRLEQGTNVTEETLLPQQDIKLYNFDPDDNIKIKLNVQGFNFSTPISIIKNGKDCDVEEIILKDANQNEGIINLARISNADNIFTYYLYTPALMVNETDLKFSSFYVKEKGSVDGAKVGGTSAFTNENFNDKIALLKSNTCNIKLNLDENYLQEHYPDYKNSSQKNVLPITALDSSMYYCQIENKNNPKDSKMFELGVYFTPVSVDKVENIYTKVMQISPRNIFYN